RSPAGIRSRGSDGSGQAGDAELGAPFVVEAGDPVAPGESVLGAGEDREAFVDVAVDQRELPPGVSVPEVVPPTTDDVVDVLDRFLQRQPGVSSGRPASGAR